MSKDDDFSQFFAAEIELTRSFMGVLLGAGFERQSVLEHAFTYAKTFNGMNTLDAARLVHQASKDLHLDRLHYLHEERVNGKVSKDG